MLTNMYQISAYRDLRQFAIERCSELAKAAEQVQWSVPEFLRLCIRIGV